jgi:hypothetical protein
MEASTGERGADEEDDDNNSELLKGRQTYRLRDLSTATNPTTAASLSSLAGKFSRIEFFSNFLFYF